MPKIRSDPRELETLALIGGIKQALRIDNKGLSQISGIKYRTLMNRIGKDGNIGDMRLYELWAIQDAAKRRGVRYEKEIHA